MHGVRFQSLVTELKSNMPHHQKKKTQIFLKPKQNIKQKQYCDKFNANFKKMVHVKKKSKKENIWGRCTEAGSKGVEK